MSTNGQTRDPKEIQADLDRTRARMGDTLDRLQHKLTPGELFDQAVHYVRANGSGELSANLKQTITRNPLPLALVGLGLAWMMISGRSGSVPREESSARLEGYGEGREGAIPLASTSTTPDDEVAEGLDTASPTSGKTGFAVYGGGKSSVSGPSDEVAEGLDEASPGSSREGAALQGGRSQTTGPSDEVSKGLDTTSSTARPQSGITDPARPPELQIERSHRSH